MLNVAVVIIRINALEQNMAFKEVEGFPPKAWAVCEKEGKDQESINQVPHLTQDTNGKVSNSQLDLTHENKRSAL